MLSKTIRFYDDVLRAEYGDPVGATEQEIVALEARLTVKLPNSVRAFLLWAGKGVGSLLIGTDCFIGDFVENTASLATFLDENNLQNPRTEPYVVFYSHQGYVLAWIYLDGGDNPEVYYFGEGQGSSEIRVVNSLDDWFYEDLAGLHGPYDK
jgi:SMI1 / KNR4 family (SUKH-1)